METRAADYDALFIKCAINHGFVEKDEVEDCLKAQRREARRGRLYSIGQVLIKRRVLSCNDFLEIQNKLERKVYECEVCKTRYRALELKDGEVSCRGCGQELGIAGPTSFAPAEILASKNPEALTISLAPTDQLAARPAEDKPKATAWGAPKGTRAPTDPPADKGGQPKRHRPALDFSIESLNVLERYEILEELGRGGMGVVFKVRQPDMDRLCALKVITASPEVPQHQINRFVQEGRSAAQLHHPNIVRVYDCGRQRNFFYISMEFLEGIPLSDRIKQRQPDLDEVLDWTGDLLDAADYAHDKGVVHRDLKPQNVMIETATGRAKLIDFGLAKDFTHGMELTQPGQILGSPFYLSPEQTRGDSYKVDGRSDVFALGVMLYEMATGYRPFTGKSAPEVYAKILKARPVPPITLAPELEHELQDIILKALEKEPEDRFQSAADMADALIEYREERAVRLAEQGDEPDDAARAARRASREARRKDRRRSDRKEKKDKTDKKDSRRDSRESSRNVSKRDRRKGRRSSSASISRPSGRIAASRRVSPIAGPGDRKSRTRTNLRALDKDMGIGSRSKVLQAVGPAPRRQSSNAPIIVAGALVAAGLFFVGVSIAKKGGGSVAVQPGDGTDPTTTGGDSAGETTGAASGGTTSGASAGSGGSAGDTGLVEVPDGPTGGTTGGETGGATGGVRLTLDERASRAFDEIKQHWDAGHDYADILYRLSEFQSRFARSGHNAKAIVFKSTVQDAASAEFSKVRSAAREAAGEGREKAAREMVDELLTRVTGLEWEAPLKLLRKDLDEGRVERLETSLDKARALIKDDKPAAAKALLEGLGETGRPDVDAAIAAMLAGIKTTLAAREAAAREAEAERIAAAEKAFEEASKMLDQRGYAEAVKRLSGVTLDDLPKRFATVLGRLKSEADELTALLSAVLALDKQIQGLRLDFGAVKGKVRRAGDGRLSIEMAGGGVVEKEISRLPAKVLATLYRKSEQGGKPAGLIRLALFFMREKSLDEAGRVLEEARRAGAETGAAEARLAELRRAGGATPKEDGGTTTDPDGPVALKPDKKPAFDYDKFLPVKGGKFLMGSRRGHVDESPQREVEIDNFLISAYEVSNYWYRQFLKEVGRSRTPHRKCHPDEPKDKDHRPLEWENPLYQNKFYRNDLPVVGIDWYDAYAFARHFGYRLPTEAEWEKAARGHDGRIYPWGSQWDPKRCVGIPYWLGQEAPTDALFKEFLKFFQRSEHVTLPVNGLPAGESMYKVRNMAGNVAEWCMDWYSDSQYSDDRKARNSKNPEGPPPQTMRVIRGGSFADRVRDEFRAARRFQLPPTERKINIGFRVIRPLHPYKRWK